MASGVYPIIVYNQSKFIVAWHDPDSTLKTVYGAFTTKSGVLRATWDLLLKGDVDEAPVAARAWYVEAIEEERPRRQVELIVRNSCRVKQRIGALLGVIRGAGSVDADAAALWELIQQDFHANQHALVVSIAEHGGLRAGLDVATATDLLWTLNHPDVWLLLVGERGWPPERFEAWFAEAARLQLLGGRTVEVAW